jgi:hypothetical protein
VRGSGRRCRQGWNRGKGGRVVCRNRGEKTMLKGIVLWAMGVPIFVIILLYMFVF